MKRTFLVSLLLLSGCLMPIMQPGSSGTGPSASSEPPPAMESPKPEQASAAAAPQTASVTIRSACSRTAKVFYGDKPGFSSGTQSSISSNSVQSKTFRVGDQMWVTDDSGKALDGVTIDTGTRQIEISSSCSSLSSRS